MNSRGDRPASINRSSPTVSCQQGAKATEQQNRSEKHEPCQHKPNTDCWTLQRQWLYGTTKRRSITVPSYLTTPIAHDFTISSHTSQVSCRTGSWLQKFENAGKWGLSLARGEDRAIRAAASARNSTPRNSTGPFPRPMSN